MKLSDLPVANYAALLPGPRIANGDGNPQGTEPQDFPTLLNIDWPAEKAVEDLDQASPLADELIMESELDSPLQQGTVSPAADASKQAQANADMSDVLAGNLLFNSQFNVSIQAAKVDDALAEAKMLIDGFNKAIAQTGLQSVQGARQSGPWGGTGASPASPTMEGVAVSSDEAVNANAPNRTPRPADTPSATSAQTLIQTGAGVGPDLEAGLGKTNIPAEQIKPNVAAPPVTKPVSPPVNADIAASDMKVTSSMVSNVKTTSTAAEGQLHFPSQITVAAIPDVAARISASLEVRQNLTASDVSLPAQPLVGSKVKVVELQLVPKNLGVVELKITKTNYGAQVHIQVETAEAERLLMAEKVSVYEAMRSVGMPVEEMKITLVARSDLENESAFGRDGEGDNFQQELTGETGREFAENENRDPFLTIDKPFPPMDGEGQADPDSRPPGLYF